jgi:excisionase family DNA binding protein
MENSRRGTKTFYRRAQFAGMNKQQKLWFTVDEAAKQLNVNDQTIRNLIDEGKLHAIDIGGGKRKFWRLPLSAIERFERARQTLPTCPSGNRWQDNAHETTTDPGNSCHTPPGLRNA